MCNIRVCILVALLLSLTGNIKAQEMDVTVGQIDSVVTIKVNQESDSSYQCISLGRDISPRCDDLCLEALFNISF